MDWSKGAIRIIIAVCVVLFALTLVPGFEKTMYEALALYFPKQENFRVWQFVTNIFMHGGFAHIFFNMYALWAFGSPLEQMWGRNKFLLFFFLAGIGAAVIYTLVNYFQYHQIYNELVSTGVSTQDIHAAVTSDVQSMRSFSNEKLQDLWMLFNIPVVGASGAIYGVLVAFGMLFPNAKLFLIFLPVPIAAKYFIPLLIALDLFSGVTGFSIFGGGIAHFGHVGGAIIGFLLMWYWRSKTPRNPDQRMDNRFRSEDVT